MKPVGVLYGTREGHTAKVAVRLGESFRARGVPVEVKNLAEGPPDLSSYEAAVIASPVHVGKHEPVVTQFVKEHARELESMPSAFLSVLLAQAGAEMANATPERRAQARAEVQQVLDRFFAETGWRPARVKPVAGALMYTKYNFFIRMVMKWIAGRSGGSTDTSRDHIYTDWAALDRFAADFAESAGLLAPERAAS